MQANLQLNATLRVEQAKANNKIRKEGTIPAVLYGQGVNNQNVKVEKTAFEKIFQKAGESTLIDLIVDNQPPIKVLIQDIQKNNVSDQIVHVDFFRVKMDKKINAEINLVFTGISPAVKDLGGVLVKNTDKIEIKCFPNDLIKELIIDISCLKTFSDLIHAKDLKLPDKLELITDKNVIIAQVSPPRSDEELKSLEGKINEDTSQVTTVEKKEKTEDEPAAEDAEKDNKTKDTKKNN